MTQDANAATKQDGQNAEKMLRQFIKARSVSTPLIAITTADPAVTMQSILNRLGDEAPAVMSYDIVRGVQGLNPEGVKAANALGSAVGIGNPGQMLSRALELPEDSILFALNAHLFIDKLPTIQGVWNLRDFNKAEGRSFVMLCPSIKLPPELANDVLILDEALPTVEELEGIISKQYNQAREDCDTIPELDADTLRRATDALIGLAAYPAEQALVLSINTRGIDFETLWERKRQMIEATEGLTVFNNLPETKVAGLKNVTTYLERLVTGKRKPRVIVLWDEIEKMLAASGGNGSAGDSSGTSQDQLQTLLKWFDDNNAQGVLFIGFPGGGKTFVAKTVAAMANAPLIGMDFGAMKSRFVGSSEGLIRSALKTASAISQGEVLVIATSNSIGNMPPEFRRRFIRGTFFFDLPTVEERRAAWIGYGKANGLEVNESTPIGFDEGWTCAEVKNCCEIANDFNLSIDEAAEFVVPVSRSMGEAVEDLRSHAEGRYISASNPGIYKRPEPESKAALNGTGRKGGDRKFKVSDLN